MFSSAISLLQLKRLIAEEGHQIRFHMSISHHFVDIQLFFCISEGAVFLRILTCTILVQIVERRKELAIGCSSELVMLLLSPSYLGSRYSATSSSTRYTICKLTDAKWLDERIGWIAKEDIWAGTTSLQVGNIDLQVTYLGKKLLVEGRDCFIVLAERLDLIFQVIDLVAEGFLLWFLLLCTLLELVNVLLLWNLHLVLKLLDLIRLLWQLVFHTVLEADLLLDFRAKSLNDLLSLLVFLLQLMMLLLLESFYFILLILLGFICFFFIAIIWVYQHRDISLYLLIIKPQLLNGIQLLRNLMHGLIGLAILALHILSDAEHTIPEVL